MKNRKIEEMPDPAVVRTDLRDLREVLRTDRESMQLADHVRDHFIKAIGDALILLDGDNQSLVDDAKSLAAPTMRSGLSQVTGPPLTDPATGKEIPS